MQRRGTCHISSAAQWCKSILDNSDEHDDPDNDKAVYNAATEDRKSNLHQIEDY